MYFYLYDSFLQEKKYAKFLTDIEARLIDLSIQGRSGKMNILNNMRETAQDALKRGAQTFVVIGDDKTVSRAIQSIIDFDLTLGIIPVGTGPHTLARCLGIPVGIEATEVLSRRVKERIDVAKVNSIHFGFYLKVLSPHIKIISTDRSYTITPTSSNVEVYACNFRPPHISGEHLPSSFFVPTDGKLELMINSLEKPSFMDKFLFKSASDGQGYTILPFQKIRIESSPETADVKIVLDGERVTKPPLDIEVLPQKVCVIVGKERQF